MTDQNGVIEIRDFTPIVDDDIKDFTLPSDGKPRRFRIRDDVFEAVSSIPVGLLPDVAGAVENLKGSAVRDNIEKVLSVFDVLLYDESAALMRQRAIDKKNPISDQHLLPIVYWLLEVYGMRPTQLSANSSDSSDTADESTTSTDGASLAVSISSVSPSLDS